MQYLNDEDLYNLKRYAVVRKDMPVEQKVVQLAHACLKVTPYTQEDRVTLIILECEDVLTLAKIRATIGFDNCEVFFDPEYHKGPTALVTRVFSKKEDISNIKSSLLENTTLFRVTK
jgi:hypothetical protein